MYKYSRKCNVKVQNIKRQPNPRRGVKELMDMSRQCEKKHHNRANIEKKPEKYSKNNMGA